MCFLDCETEVVDGWGILDAMGLRNALATRRGRA